MRFGRPQLVIAATLAAATVVVAILVVRASAEQDAERAFREARAYTVRIRTQIETPFIEDEQGSSQGAGFLIDARRGWILTNAHVVGHSPSEVQVAFAGEEFQPARKVYVDPFADVAVLAIEDVDLGHPVARLDADSEVRVGEPVGAFGHPMGMYFTGTRGIVSGKTDQFGPDLLQIDATVDHGNSGGPTLSLRTGRVVGIATAAMRASKGDRVNFATPMKDVGRILDLLRDGVMPAPPECRFALLRDETDSHTLEVARSHDPQRWPLQAGDRILGIRGEGGTVESLTDLVSRLRGRSGAVTIRVARSGKEVDVEVNVTPTPLVTAARGVSIDGALLAPIGFDDATSLVDQPRLFVHSVAPGSTAEALQLDPADILHTIDGRSFHDLDQLSAFLSRRPQGRPMKVVLMRSSPFTHRWFDYIVRELPGEDIVAVGPAPAPEPVAAKSD